MRFLVLFLCVFLITPLHAQLTIVVDQIPSNTPETDPIHIVGDFQGWNPGDLNFTLSEDVSLQRHFIDLPAVSGAIEFKFTRGSWATVEGTQNGGFIPNRNHNVNPGDTLSLQILGWEDLSGNGSSSTAADNVQILTDSFYMPQLNRYRKVWVYLPPDYETSGIDYPVLYMHDGQNVFDASTSFIGEWEVDETLNDLHTQGDPGIIVVAVDNGQNLRLDEYTPWWNPNYGGGEGAQYVNFLVQTLKPYIDNTFRTMPGRDHTGIMGSSLGGLISLYAGIEHQEVFGKVGAFSPAYWINPEAYSHVSTTGKQDDMRIYQLVGTQEGTQYVNDMFAMENTLFSSGFGTSEVLSVERSDGQHSEWFWAREFEEAYLWLFGNLSTSTERSTSVDYQVSVYPNPTADFLGVQVNVPNPAELVLSLYDPSGKRVAFFENFHINSGYSAHQINLLKYDLTPGMYFLSISINDKINTIPIVVNP